ncbi:unnamed protein product [Prorocentrum cordatum]|uniref:Uncharacterized protein n=1 Tax=Prorocentrum cordatum TaxID=2364126 RepID=A0ABN9P887_9DINO|nr:unnamed protein product [Polarella glacialis]
MERLLGDLAREPEGGKKKQSRLKGPRRGSKAEDLEPAAFTAEEAGHLRQLAALFRVRKSRQPAAGGRPQLPPFAALLRKAATGQVVALLRLLRKLRLDMQEGDTMVVPVPWNNPRQDEPEFVFLILELKASDCWRVALCNTGIGREFHVKTSRVHPKQKCKTVMVLDDIPAERIHDEAWWLFLFTVPMTKKTQDPSKIYEFLLPWLAQEQLECALAKSQKVVDTDFRTPFDACFHRLYLETFHYLLRVQHGWSRPRAKLFSLRLREVFVSFIEHDLRHCVRLSPQESQLISMILQQLALATAKGCQDEDGALTTGRKRAEYPQRTLERMRALRELMSDAQLRRGGGLERTAPPLLDLVANGDTPHTSVPRAPPAASAEPARGAIPAVDHGEGCGDGRSADDWDMFPFFEYFVRQDISNLEGAETDERQQPAVNFLSIPREVRELGCVTHVSGDGPERVSAVHDQAVRSIWHTVKTCEVLCARLDNMRDTGFHYQKCALVTDVFARVLPIPVGPESLAKRQFLDVWGTGVMTLKLQVDLCLTLQRIATIYCTSAFSIAGGREFETTRIITLGAMCAMIDAVLRRPPDDLERSLVAPALGEKPDHFGISHHCFAKQTETIEIPSPDLCVARANIIAYFDELHIKNTMWSWEEGQWSMQAPDQVGEEFAKRIQKHLYRTTQGSAMLDSYTVEYCPEYGAWRDITLLWKYMMVTENRNFPKLKNYQYPGWTSPVGIRPAESVLHRGCLWQTDSPHPTLRPYEEVPKQVSAVGACGSARVDGRRHIACPQSP